jgi:hypothetical protein
MACTISNLATVVVQGSSPYECFDQPAISDSLFLAFGENVIYVNANGVETEVEAVIDRLEHDDMDGTPRGSGPVLHATFRNCSTSGVLASSISEGRDRVKLFLRFGGTVQTRTVARILDQTKEIVKVLLR